MDDTLIRYAHFLGILLLASMLVAENILLSRALPQRDLQRLLFIDAAYGLGAMLTLAAGLMLWLMVGKAAAFYSANPLFHAKLGVFVLVALMSLKPTFFFLRHRGYREPVLAVPGGVVLVKRLELLALLVLPLLAVLVAKGVGVS